MSEKVLVRIALATDKNGAWNAIGWSGGADKKMLELVSDGERRYFLTAELELPEAPQVQTCEVESVEEAT